MEQSVSDEDPSHIGLLQHNLGRTLMDLGRLEEALDAFASALAERPRETEPMRWAMTKYSSAGTLLLMGDRDRSTKHLDDAMTEASDALTVRRRDRVPVEWAMTMALVGGIHRCRLDLTSDPREEHRAREASGAAIDVFEAAGRRVQARIASAALGQLDET